MGRKRNVAFSISLPHLIPGMLARSDMLAIVPDYVAHMMVGQGGLRAEPLPVERPALDLTMRWPQGFENDPAQRWLRSRLRMFLGE
jgi:LysR family transcriptional activator of mexEF-oprN operon